LASSAGSRFMITGTSASTSFGGTCAGV
jgi:hypothetical protein